MYYLIYKKTNPELWTFRVEVEVVVAEGEGEDPT
jgi:hypothetical protein